MWDYRIFEIFLIEFAEYLHTAFALFGGGGGKQTVRRADDVVEIVLVLHELFGIFADTVVIILRKLLLVLQFG